MKSLVLSICLAGVFAFALPSTGWAHNPDGSLTQQEVQSIALEQDTIYQMQLSIVWALQQTPIDWWVIRWAQIVIEEAWGEIDAVENH